MLCAPFLPERGLLALAMVGTFAVCAPGGMIDIGFTQLDLAYDGENVTEEGDGDMLGAITVSHDGEVIATYTGGTIELEIPGVVDIDMAGDSVTTDKSGWLLLTLPTGDTVHLSLSNVTVNYLDSGAFGGFAFGGTIASVMEQTLPVEMQINEAANVSFSASVVSSTNDGTHLTSFKASGTGQVRGSLLVPEPTTAAAVGLMFLVGTAAAAMRAKLG